jgi:hypothetical protein
LGQAIKLDWYRADAGVNAGVKCRYQSSLFTLFSLDGHTLSLGRWVSAAVRKRGEFADLKLLIFFRRHLVQTLHYQPLLQFCSATADSDLTLGRVHFQTGGFGTFSRRR